MLQGWLLSAASAEAVYNLPLPSALCPAPCARAGGDHALCLRPSSTGGSSQAAIRGRLQGASGIL